MGLGSLPSTAKKRNLFSEGVFFPPVDVCVCTKETTSRCHYSFTFFSLLANFTPLIFTLSFISTKPYDEELEAIVAHHSNKSTHLATIQNDWRMRTPQDPKLETFGRSGR